MNVHKLFDIVNISRRAFGRYKWQIAALAALGFISGLLEGIGINMLIPLFSFFTNQDASAGNVINTAVERLFTFLQVDMSVTYLLVFIVFLFLGKAMLSFLFSYIKIRIDTDYEESTRNNLFQGALNASWPHLLMQKIGYLDTILMTDVLRGSLLIRQIANIILAVTGLFVYSLVAINISFPVTALTLGFGAVLFLLFRPLFFRTRLYAKRASEANKEVAHYVNESIAGMKTIKSLQSSEAIASRGNVYFSELRNLRVKTLLFITASSSLLQPISLIFIVIVFAVSYKTPTFNLAALIAVVYLIQKMFQYIQQLHSNVHEVNDAIPYVESLLTYQHDMDSNREEDKGMDSYAFKSSLAMRNVSFHYRGDRPVLSVTNFVIRKGEAVGLIGESGSGKTTIVDLLLRLFDPTVGAIFLDGKDIRTIRLSEWRKHVGYVSQDIFLRHDTIRNNITFSDPSITEEDMVRAAKMANIYKFVQSRPDAFSTVVGERGIMLSVGQRQRIAIARVLSRKPDILILDEATSALDNESEARIQEVIENLRGKVTVLIIAHRLSTVTSTDRVLVLEGGRITEEGKPKELLANRASRFYQMYHAHARAA